MRALVSVLVGLAVLVAAGLFTMRYFEDRITDEMVAHASKLAVPATWRQLDDVVYRKQFLCASPNPCPGIARHWEADRSLVSADDLKAIAKPAGLDLTVDRPCQRGATAIGESILCNGSGTVGQYTYKLTLISPGPGSNTELSLDVRPTTS